MKTSIEWTQQVWNPVRGCSRVSPGCDNCYAMRMAHRSNVPGGAYEGLTTIRKGKVDWAGMARLIPEQLELPLRRRKPTTYFVNSMSDLFHESLTSEEIAAVFGVMAACPQHTFQVLTKRPKRMLEWFSLLDDDAPETVACHAAQYLYPDNPAAHASFEHHSAEDWPLPNVWLGASAENEEQLRKREEYLARCPAAVRWFSLEPLLGPVNLALIGTAPKDWGHGYTSLASVFDWYVVGGESGNGARSFDIQWAWSIVEQCKAAGVPCFVKQLGRYPSRADSGRFYQLGLQNRKGADMSEWPEDLRVREFPEARS